jgi:hypothetical protein
VLAQRIRQVVGSVWKQRVQANGFGVTCACNMLPPGREVQAEPHSPPSQVQMTGPTPPPKRRQRARKAGDPLVPARRFASFRSEICGHTECFVA